MNYNDAIDALNNHTRVFVKAILRDPTPLYIESLTCTISCGDDKYTHPAYFANLSNGTQVAISELTCDRDCKTTRTVSSITFRTLRHGDHTPLSQIQETIDAYEARMKELTAEIDAIHDWSRKNLAAWQIKGLHECINKAYKEANKQNAEQNDSPHEVHEEGTTAISKDDRIKFGLSSDVLRKYGKYFSKRAWENDKEFAAVNLERIRKAAEEYINKHSENEPVVLNCKIYINK